MAQDRSFEGKRNPFRNKYWAIATAGYSDNMCKQDILSICETKNDLSETYTHLKNVYIYSNSRDVLAAGDVGYISNGHCNEHLIHHMDLYTANKKSTVPANEGYIIDKQQCY